MYAGKNKGMKTIARERYLARQATEAAQAREVEFQVEALRKERNAVAQAKIIASVFK